MSTQLLCLHEDIGISPVARALLPHHALFHQPHQKKTIKGFELSQSYKRLLRNHFSSLAVSHAPRDTMAEHGSEGRVHHSDSSDSEADILNLQDDEGWEDAEPDELSDTVVSFFGQETFPDIHAMIRHCKEKHGFDFIDIRQKLNLDFYGSIKLVNYIRACARDGKAVSADLKWEDINDDSFLKPVLADDAVIFNLDELEDIVPSNEQETMHSGNATMIARVSELEDELKRLQTHFDSYRDTVAKNLDERWNSPSSSSNTNPAQSVVPRDDDSHYFKSYSYNGT